MTTPTLESTDAIAAIDIGGTTLKGAVFNLLGEAIAEESAPTFAVERDAYAGIVTLVGRLRIAARSRNFQVVGVGLASPGLVDGSAGTVAYAANLSWNEMQLRHRLETEVGLPVFVDHDARAGAIAEQAAHPGEQDAFQDFIFIPIGTGVAAAIVASGIIVHGHTGAAGEFGHMPIVRNGDLCGCGQQGCLEAYASASNIFARYRRLGGRQATSTPEIAANVSTDNVAESVWNDAIEALAVGIAALSAVLDPARIVIGGGLAQAGGVLLEPLRSSVDRKLGWRPTPPIIQSSLGSHAGLIGAAMLAADRDRLAKGFALSAHESLSVPAGYLPAQRDNFSRRANHGNQRTGAAVPQASKERE